MLYRAILDPFGVDPLFGELVIVFIPEKGPAILIWQIINLAGLLLPNFWYDCITNLLTDLFTKLHSLF